MAADVVSPMAGSAAAALGAQRALQAAHDMPTTCEGKVISFRRPHWQQPLQILPATEIRLLSVPWRVVRCRGSSGDACACDHHASVRVVQIGGITFFEARQRVAKASR